MKLSIVIPCYNEAENIPLILRRFQRVIDRDDIEVIVVDNGSNDKTSLVMKELLPEYSFAKSVRVKVNRGYGYGIRKGLQSCSGKFLGWTHADMQTDPADLIKALHIIEKNHDREDLLVKGRRRGRPLADCFFTAGMSIFETVYLGRKLVDVNAQPNVFSRKFYETWKHPPTDFSLDLYVLFMAQKKKQKIIRFDVVFPKRIHGTSHWNNGLSAKAKFIRRTAEFSRKLKKEGIR